MNIVKWALAFFVPSVAILLWGLVLIAKQRDRVMRTITRQEFRGCTAPRCIYGTDSTEQQCRYCVHARRRA